MKLTDLPSTAVLVSPGVWNDSVIRTKFYLDPSNPNLLVYRSWTTEEVTAFEDAAREAADAFSALRDAIGDRVSDLRDAGTAAETFTLDMTARAAIIRTVPPDDSEGFRTAIRDELALIRDDLAASSARSDLAIKAVADLAMVVSDTL